MGDVKNEESLIFFMTNFYCVIILIIYCDYVLNFLNLEVFENWHNRQLLSFEI